MKTFIILLFLSFNFANAQVELIPNDENKPKVPDETQFAEIAQKIFQDQDYNNALMLLDSYLAKHPKVDAAWMFQGIAFMGVKDYQKAIRSFNTVLNMKPDNHDAWNKKGQSYYFLKDYDKALSSINKAISLNAENPDAWNTKGLILKRQKKFSDSEKALKRSVEVDGEYSVGYYNLTCLYVTWGKKDKAYDSLKKCFELNDKFKKYAQNDDELKSIKYDPKFQTLY